MPVLSAQITVTLPSVSSESRRRTRAFFFTIRFTPIAKQTVTTAGSPSGTAETARLTAIKRISTNVRSCIQPIPTTTKHRPSTTIPIIFPSFFIRSCNGVSGILVSETNLAIFPISVSVPIAVTMYSAEPAATSVPAKTILV